MTLQPIVSSEEWEAKWQAPPAGIDHAARAVRKAKRREPIPTRLHPAVSFDRRSTVTAVPMFPKAERLMGQVAGLGRLRVLINNADEWLPGPQYPAAALWRPSIDLDLVAPMLAARLARPLMSTSGDSIVNVAASGGLGSRSRTGRPSTMPPRRG